jgi:1,2-diacylglycerol 3-beta-galactosyltransferase
VLIAGGGAGVGPIKELAEAIQAARLDVQLVIVCGHNEVLRRRLVDRLDPERCQVHGFVRNLHELMQASDILLSKSGPGTVAEALACGLPVFITSCTSGTESGNAEFYESLGVARFVPEVNRCVEALREMASGDRGEIDCLRANIDKGAPWNRTPTIADEIRRFCRQAEQEASLGFTVSDLARSGAGVVWERG